MVYKFHDRLDHLGVRTAESSELVTIRRAAVETTQVKAFAILARAVELLPGTTVARVESQDFVFAMVDYKFGAVSSLPRHGDQLVRASGETFVVTSPTDGPAYKFTTAKRNRIRVHYDRLIAG